MNHMSSRRTRIAFSALLVLVVALSARLHRTAAIPTGEEEYLVYNRAADTLLPDYLERMYWVSPDHLPAYYIFVYGARIVLGYGDWVPRGLAMAFGLAFVLLGWAIATRRFGASAGLVAGLLFALAPDAIYFSATWRSYSLQMLLGAVSFWCIFRAVETGRRRYWATAVCANTMFTWIHPWGLLIFATEGLWLLGVWILQAHTHWQRRLLTTTLRGAGWGGAHALALVVAVSWWYAGTDENVSWYLPPTPTNIVADLLGDAFIHNNTFVYDPVPEHGRAHYDRMAIHSSFDFWASRTADAALGALIIIGLLGAAVRLWKANDRRLLACLFLFAFVPPLILNFLSLAWFPLGLPRYSASSNFALYLLVAAGFATLPFRFFRRAVPIATMLLLVYLGAMWTRVVPDPDWRGAAKLAAAAPNPDAAVILLRFTTTGDCANGTRLRRLLEYFGEEKGVRYRQAYTIDGAVDACVAQAMRTGRPVSLMTRSLWNWKDDHVQVLRALRHAGFKVAETQHGDFRFYVAENSAPAATWNSPVIGIRKEYFELLSAYLPPDISADEVYAALRWTLEPGDALEEALGSSRLVFQLLEISPRVALAAARLHYAIDPQRAAAGLLVAERANGDCTAGAELLSVAEDRMAPLFSRTMMRAISNCDWPVLRESMKARQSKSGILAPQVFTQLAGLERPAPQSAWFSEQRP